MGNIGELGIVGIGSRYDICCRTLLVGTPIVVRVP